MSTLLVRQELNGVPEQTVRVLKAYAINATEVFVTFIRNGQIYGDVFSVPDSNDVTVLATNEDLSEGDYINITFTPAATVSGIPVCSDASVVTN